MKGIKRLSAGILTGIVMLSLTSCFSYQEKWGKLLSDEFSDDSFTYIGVEPGELGPHGDIANFRSEEYPDLIIRVIKEDGDYITNYNYVRYKEEIEEDFEEYFSGFFDCQGIKCRYDGPGYHLEYTPIEDMSLSEYISDYVKCEVHLSLFYDQDIDETYDDEMRQILIDIAQDRGEAVDIYIDVYNGPEEDDPDYSEILRNYVIHMNEENTINYISASSRGGNDRVFLAEDLVI